jgi:N-methylhydantoinase B
VRLPPVLLQREGIRDGTLLRVLLANVRTPVQRAGDVAAQLAALSVGARRLGELMTRRGRAEVAEAMTALMKHADRLLRRGCQGFRTASTRRRT